MSDSTKDVNLEWSGADKKRYEFPASPLSERGESSELPHVATVDGNNEQSAGAVLRRLADVVSAWRSQLPSEVQPALIAILHGGIQLDVERLAQEGFHDIRVEGSFDFRRSPQCLVVAHRSTLQFLAYVQTIAPFQKHASGRPQRLIGFVIGGKSFDA